MLPPSVKCVLGGVLNGGYVFCNQDEKLFGMRGTAGDSKKNGPPYYIPSIDVGNASVVDSTTYRGS